MSILCVSNSVGVFAEDQVNRETNVGEFDISVLSSIRLQQSEEQFDYFESNSIDDNYEVVPCTPASVNPTSTCVGSACVGSACTSSGCGGSGCVSSTCGGSACAGSVCGGSACVGSICGGSVCVGSVCARCKK